LGADPDTLTDELFLHGLMRRSSLDADAVFAAGPRGLDVAPETGWVHETMLPGGRWRLAPDVLLARLAAHVGPAPVGLVLTPRREVAWSNSVRYAGAGAEPVVRLHPSDAEAAGLADGDEAELTSEHGTLTATASVDPHVRPGVVSVTHSRSGPGPGRLTSTRAGVDRLTGMPHASGLPVTIAPARRPRPT
jgi:formylmethanofuran dehydrogenase subunit D